MKFTTQAAVAAIAAALLASPVLAQTKQGPLPPTGGASDYQAPSASSPGTMPKAAQSTSTKSATKSPQAVSKSTTRQEYLDQAAKRFDAMDGNRDGTLTSAERSAYNEKLRAAAASKASPSPSATSGSRAISPPPGTSKM